MENVLGNSARGWISTSHTYESGSGILLKAADSITMRAVEYSRECSALYVGVDRVSGANSSSVFNVVVGGPIHFHISSFRLGSRREFAVGVDLAVSNSYSAVINTSNDTPAVKAYALVNTKEVLGIYAECVVPSGVPPQGCNHGLQLFSNCSALDTMCIALHAVSSMLTFSILTVPRGGQCTCSHSPSTKIVIVYYA